MADLSISADRLTVILGWWEKLAARRSDFTLPMRAIVGVTVCPSAIGAAGVEEGGERRLQATRIPGLIATGTYANDGTGSRTFLASHRSGPGLVLDLEGATVDRVILSTPHAEIYAEELARHGAARVDGDR